MKAFNVQVHREPHANAVVAKISGDAGIEHIDELERHLAQLAKDAPSVIVLDLAELDYIASLGLGALLKYRDELESHGSRLKLAALAPFIEQAIKNAWLQSAFEIHPTIASALNAAKPQA